MAMDVSARAVLARELLEASTKLADLGQAMLAGIASAESSEPELDDVMAHVKGIQMTMLWLRRHEGAA